LDIVVPVDHDRRPVVPPAIVRKDHRMPWSIVERRLKTDPPQFGDEPVRAVTDVATVFTIRRDTREAQVLEEVVQVLLVHVILKKSATTVGPALTLVALVGEIPEEHRHIYLSVQHGKNGYSCPCDHTDCER